MKKTLITPPTLSVGPKKKFKKLIIGIGGLLLVCSPVSAADLSGPYASEIPTKSVGDSLSITDFNAILDVARKIFVDEKTAGLTDDLVGLGTYTADTGTCPTGTSHVDFNDNTTVEAGECFQGAAIVDGKLGIGTITPTTKLDVAGEIRLDNNSWISARDSAGTGVVNMFRATADGAIELGASLLLGALTADTDSGAVSIFNMPVSSSAGVGTEMSASVQLDSENIFKIYAESDGSGGIQNKSVQVSGSVHATGFCDEDGLNCKTITELSNTGTDDQTASEVTATDEFDNSDSTNVQDILDDLDTVLSLKAPSNSPTFTGTVSGITSAMVGLGNVTNESKATMFTNAALTGIPTAPTAAPATNTTQIATTAFVTEAVTAGADTDWTEGSGNVYRLSGNVGIGTTAPESKLQVAGSATLGVGNDTVTNGTFAADSDWTKGAGWTIPGGTTANFSGDAYSALRQDLGLDAGDYVVIEFDASNITGATANFDVGAATYGAISDGHNVFYRTVGTGGYEGFISFYMDGTGTFSIDNVSVKKVGEVNLQDTLRVVDGNVGIGTTTPAAKLQIGTGTPNQSVAVERQLYIAEDAEFDGKVSFDGSTHFNGATYITGNYLETPLGYMESTSANSLALDSPWNSLVLTTNVNRHRNADHGNKTNPTFFIQSATDPDVDNTEWGSLSFEGTGAGDGYFKIASGVGDIALQPEGNVGIGTTSPVNPLHVSSTSSQDILTIQRNSTADNAEARINFDVTGNPSGITTAYISAIRKPSGSGIGSLAFGTVSEGMRITDEGNVGIGTSTPETFLHIDAGEQLAYPSPVFKATANNGGADRDFTIEFTGSSGGNWQMGADSSSRYILKGYSVDLSPTNASGGTRVAGSGDFSVYTDDLFVDQSEGRVGIGTTSPTATLHLKAGTTAANTAPLKFTAGTNLTTPEAGVMEYDGTDLFFTPDTTRKTLAFIESPDFTGTPTAPTAGSSTNTTQIATTAFVQNVISGLSASSIIEGDTSVVVTDSGSDGTITLTTEGSTAMIIDSDGNVDVTDGTFTVDGVNVMPMYVGLTAGTYNGAFTYTGGFTGYKAANEICNAEGGAFADSHMCSVDEIFFTINNLSSYTWTNGTQAWVSTGAAKYPSANNTNDCNGWLHDGGSSYYGNFWEFSAMGGVGKTALCSSSFKIACCK